MTQIAEFTIQYTGDNGKIVSCVKRGAYLGAFGTGYWPQGKSGPERMVYQVFVEGEGNWWTYTMPKLIS